MDLILAICLIADPGVCREERLTITLEPVGPLYCQMLAQPIIATWTQQHPKWTVVRHRCAVTGAREIEA